MDKTLLKIRNFLKQVGEMEFLRFYNEKVTD